MQPADCGERERKTERKKINLRASEKKETTAMEVN